jgi:hypothetical protein
MGEIRNASRILVGMNVRDHSEDVGVDEKIILGLILWKQVGKVWTGCIWLKIGTSGMFL